MSAGRRATALALACASDDLAARESALVAISAGPIDWSAVHEAARRERLAALAWHRNGEWLAGSLPATVAAAWRGDHRAEAGRAARRLAELEQILAAFDGGGVAAVVMKGLPLAQRLYGDAALRPTADLDLWVDAADRARAHELLAPLGWVHLSGHGPAEGVYAASRGTGARDFLELHSHLADDALLAHLTPPAVEWEWTDVDGVHLRAQSGAYLPAYLAVHLAKHVDAPLLWIADLGAVWQALGDERRREAVHAAREARAERYLAWALRLVDALPGAARGDAEALAALGIDDAGRVRRGHNALRVARLARTPADALRVAGAWAWPNAEGRGAEFARRRIRMLWSVARGRSSRADSPPAASAVAPSESRVVNGAGLIEAVRTIVADAGGGMWVRAQGRSMEPAVPHGARVRLVPLGRDGPRRGDVVFAETGPTRAVVHRVVARVGGWLLLQGDAMALSDPPLTREQVLARVEQVEIGTAAVPVDARPRPSLRRRLRRAPRQLAAVAALLGRSSSSGRLA